jgi:RNA polymerase-binding transcription factor DksA
VKNKFNKKELAEFKKLILKQKEGVLEEIKHISDDTLKKSQKEASGDISGYTYHMADMATDTYDREFSLGLASNERKLLYEECKSLIAKNRLKAVPYARLCVKCQEKKEKK